MILKILDLITEFIQIYNQKISDKWILVLEIWTIIFMCFLDERIKIGIKKEAVSILRRFFYWIFLVKSLFLLNLSIDCQYIKQ